MDVYSGLYTVAEFTMAAAQGGKIYSRLVHRAVCRCVISLVLNVPLHGRMVRLS